IGILSVICITFTLSIVLSRNGSRTYKLLTAQSLIFGKMKMSPFPIAYLLYDLQLCFITCPHLVMQHFSGYTLGCLHVSAKFQFVAILFNLVQIVSSAYICVLYRHQSILPSTSNLKMLSTLDRTITFFAFNIGCSLLCISVALAVKDTDEVEWSPSWLLARNSIVAPPSLFSIGVVVHMCVAELVIVLLVSFTFWHMHHTLKVSRKHLAVSSLLLLRTCSGLLLSPLSLRCVIAFFDILSSMKKVRIENTNSDLTCYIMFLFASNSIATTLAIVCSSPDYR
ncbi:hypothetical protein PMAYCL1PPCAC_08353, partial [Pristionchus mayeri]